MLLTSNRSRSRRRLSAGFTLAELVVTVALSGIVGGAILAFFLGASQAAQTQDSHAQAQAAARLATNRFVRDVRQSNTPDNGATPTISALDSGSVTMFVDQGRSASAPGGPFPRRYSRVIWDAYQPSAGAPYQLRRREWLPNEATCPCTYPTVGTTPNKTETLIDNLTNGARPVFQALVPAPAGSDPYSQSYLPNPVAAAQLRNIAQVTLDLFVGQKTGSKATETELTTDAALRNRG